LGTVFEREDHALPEVATSGNRLVQRSLVPTAEAWMWQLRARCRAEDPSMFFSPEGERGRARVLRVLRAKAVCAECPVTRECRAHSLKYQEAFGVWGGLSEAERAIVLARVSARNRGLDA
jgi:WhiB family transcriptional regulator, redox-sensing transcriptional regulator